ncbi:MAG TPA: hypothetical protein VJO34_02660 [Methylomirabilota bacterium]|nr:hypothetical protein [Methylomirabilota bacterium]
MGRLPAPKKAERVPIWLGRLGMVAEELKTTNFPSTAEEGLKQCAELSAMALHILREQVQSDAELYRLINELTADDARHAERWRRDCARFFGR